MAHYVLNYVYNEKMCLLLHEYSGEFPQIENVAMNANEDFYLKNTEETQTIQFENQFKCYPCEQNIKHKTKD